VDLRFCRVRLWRYQCNFAACTFEVGRMPIFLACFNQGGGFANAAPSVIKLAEFRIGCAKYDNVSLGEETVPPVALNPARSTFSRCR
jgi:hypothetical protein